MNEEQLAKSFLSIERQLAEVSTMVKGIRGELTKMNGSIHELQVNEGTQNERLARLETKTAFYGAIAGAAVATLIGGVRWIVGK